MMSQVMMTTRFFSPSASTTALAARGCATPCDGLDREAYPDIQTGWVGVVSTRATPACQSAWDEAPSPKSNTPAHQQTRPLRFLITSSSLASQGN